MHIRKLTTPEEIALSFDIFLELRPYLPDVTFYINQVMQQQKEGYEIIALMPKEEVVACAGFRIMTTLAWGKTLYIDDLITGKKERGKGYAQTLLHHISSIARENQCAQIHLDTGYTRHTAHKLYVNHGFDFHCHHLSLKVR